MRIKINPRSLRRITVVLAALVWLTTLIVVTRLSMIPAANRSQEQNASERFRQDATSAFSATAATRIEGQRDARSTDVQPVRFEVPRQLEIPRFPNAQLLETDGSQSSHQVVSLCQFATSFPFQGQPMPSQEYGFGGAFGAPIDTGSGGPRSVAMNCPGAVPWQAFSYSQFVEPARRPFVPEYRVRVGDQLLFIFHVTRYESADPYRIGVGDVISIDSDSHDELNKKDIQVLPDGTISISPLQTVQAAGKTFAELKQTLEIELTAAGIRDPRVTVLPVKVNLPNQDLRDAVDGRQGVGGQRLEVRVTWDGCVRLPKIDDVPVVGLTLAEVSAEINSRLTAMVSGIQVTPILSQSAPAFVYVLGEVTQQGQLEATRPMTALQAITQAGGFLPGANMRDVIVLRRTADWQLIATRLDLWDAGYGKGLPYEDIWLHDGDIVIVPRTRIERLAELADLYFTRTVYRVMPNQGFTFAFTSASTVFN